VVTSETREPPETVHRWAVRATALVAAACEDLTGSYLHGSAALGGWQPGRSDVDMVFVTGGDLSAAGLGAVTKVLFGATGDCPGHALECSVVTAGQARRAQPPWPFLLHVNGSARRARAVVGEGGPGDPDLLMHYAVCRAAGWTLTGPPPAQVFGRVPRPQILAYLAEELSWGLGHAPERYSVLNGSRALCYAEDGVICSKLEGGTLALDRGLGAPALLRRALAQQRGLLPERERPAADAVAFVESVIAKLRAAGPHQPAG
jgi:aminoglycoside adenylyltransferase-like protein